MNRRIGYLCFIIAAVVFSTFALFIRGLQDVLDPVQQALFRAAAALVVIGPWMVATTTRDDRKALADYRLWMFGLIFPFSVVLWTWSTILGTVRTSVFGLYLGSLLGAVVFGRVFFGERLTRKIGVGLVLTLGGLWMFCHSASTVNPVALTVGALAGVSQAASLCFRRWLGDVNRTLVVFAQFVGPVVLGVVYCGVFDPVSPAAFAADKLAIAFSYGVLVAGVSYLILLGAQNIEISLGSIILSTELIWATLIAAVFLHEVPTTSEIIGCVLLLLAAVAIK